MLTMLVSCTCSVDIPQLFILAVGVSLYFVYYPFKSIGVSSMIHMCPLSFISIYFGDHFAFFLPYIFSHILMYKFYETLEV